jgi:hypothetical protein
LYDVEGIKERGEIRPGEVRANVFDFPDGMRLIVSSNLYPEGETQSTFSSSLFPDTEMFHRMRRCCHSRKEGIDWFMEQSVARFLELSGEKEKCLQFVGITENYIPHWVVE